MFILSPFSSKDYGIHVPKKLSILGLGNLLNGQIFGELTSVDEHHRTTVQPAVSLLRRRIDEGEDPG